MNQLKYSSLRGKLTTNQLLCAQVPELRQTADTEAGKALERDVQHVLSREAEEPGRWVRRIRQVSACLQKQRLSGLLAEGGKTSSAVQVPNKVQMR